MTVPVTGRLRPEGQFEEVCGGDLETRRSEESHHASALVGWGNLSLFLIKYRGGFHHLQENHPLI